MKPCTYCGERVSADELHVAACRYLTAARADVIERAKRHGIGEVEADALFAHLRQARDVGPARLAALMVIDLGWRPPSMVAEPVPVETDMFDEAAS